jgi:hypothetical protein
MAYEMFTRSAVRVDTPTVSVVPDGRMALNAATCRVLSNAGIAALTLLWDKSKYKLALKAARKGDPNAFSVSLSPDKHSGSLRAKSFFVHIGWRAPKREMLPAIWNEKERMFEISVPPEHLKIDRVRTL